MGKYVIYSLFDPRDNSTRYVGMTNDLYERFLTHLRCDGTSPLKDAWIQELQAANILVVMQTLQVVNTAVEARVREAYWIHHYLQLGARLYNNAFPVPMHLQPVAKQKRTFEEIQQAELAASALCTGTLECVKELRAQGWGKTKIIEKVWLAKPGGTKAYKAALAEYDRIEEMIAHQEGIGA